MSNTVLLKKSSVTGKVPAIGDLIFGELALNYADGFLYYKNTDGTIQSIQATTAQITDGIVVWVRSGAGVTVISRSGYPVSVTGQQSLKVPYSVTPRVGADIAITH